MLPLFADWTKIARRLRNAPLIALFLDFDGTLARLKPTPEQVSLDGSVRQALATLGRSKRFRIWIVSGRRQADIRARVAVPGIRYLGLHGWERRAGAALGAGSGDQLATILNCLDLRLASIPGIWIENKKHALAVHYRAAAAPAICRARTVLEDVLAPHASLRLQPGKRVWEILPNELEDKGAAVRRELAMFAKGVFPIYVGDDKGDEPAFAALREGLTIRIGQDPRSRARYRLSGVRQVRAFLHKLIAGIA